jgi:hypothetical protein
MIIFHDETDLPQLLEDQKIHRIILIEYFIANRIIAERVIRGEVLEFDCRELLYHDFPDRMIWDKRIYQWKVR